MPFVTRTLWGYRPPPKRPDRSLEQLSAEKTALLAICRRCKHRRVFYPARLAAELGGDFQVIELRQRLRCSGCGARAVNLHETTR